MRIALYGYGKMGKAIEAAAVARGHIVVQRVGSGSAGEAPVAADVVIEFSTPDAVIDNVGLCLHHGLPVVIGTTGWYDRINDLRSMVSANGGSALWASNFSIGVNIFFRVNRMLAGLMDAHTGYRVHIDEIHHIHKRDAPSGTAISLARDIDVKTHRYSGYELKEFQGRDQGNALPHPARTPSPVPIISERIGEVPGKHAVSWTSGNDRMVITHEAFDRTGFAQGAVVAAEWLKGRKGLFTMDDVLDAM